MKKLIAILGPTASGKTTLAIKTALALNAEIVSCDSRQFFKELSIGTAKPTAQELAKAPHHFIGHKSIHDTYTAGMFEKDAIEKITALHQESDYAIMVGGSGMYARAVFNGIDDIPSDETIRANIIQHYEQTGIEYLQKELQERDPAYMVNADTQNPQRLMRALEVCLVSGKPYSSFRSGQAKERNFSIHKFVLNWDRDTLYKRINARVDYMMAQGLLEEALSMRPHKHLNSLNTVGYKELFEYLDGQCTLEEAVDAIKQNTRRFAKRQLTWFKKEEDAVWLDADGRELEDIVGEVLAFIK